MADPIRPALSREAADKLVTDILLLVAHVERGNWWGHDTNCGREKDVIHEAVELLRYHGVAVPK